MRGQKKSFCENGSYTALYSYGALIGGRGSTRLTRRLILVDIENYCGKGVLEPCDIRKAKSSITEDLALTDNDLVVVGTSHGMNCLTSGIEWRGPRQVLRKGHDGADLALINAAREYKLETFAVVIIVSGDGIFADVALRAKACSKPTLVVSRRGSLSRKLAVSASAVRYVLPAA